MEYLQRVLEIYSKLPLSLHNSLGDTVIDALVKIIRVVANMSVNAEVGIALGRNDSLQLIFLQLLKASSSTAAVSPLAILTQAKQIKLVRTAVLTPRINHKYNLLLSLSPLLPISHFRKWIWKSCSM